MGTVVATVAALPCIRCIAFSDNPVGIVTRLNRQWSTGLKTYAKCLIMQFSVWHQWPCDISVLNLMNIHLHRNRTIQSPTCVKNKCLRHNLLFNIMIPYIILYTGNHCMYLYFFGLDGLIFQTFYCNLSNVSKCEIS